MYQEINAIRLTRWNGAHLSGLVTGTDTTVAGVQGITGSRLMKPPKLSTTLTMIVAFIVLTAVTAVVIERSYALSRETRDLDSAWRFHRDVCLKIPEGRFTEDRARAVRGTVRDAEGRPVPGALVRCLPLTSLMKLARIAPPNLAAWSGLVEAETRTDADGRYEFFHFAEGSRTVCVSASGLAPAVQGPIVVQDGSGGRIDLTLDAPETLHIRLKETDGSPRRVTLVPHRWWPELVSHDVAAGVSEVEIAGLGGPYRQGLVLLSGPDGPTWVKKAGVPVWLSVKFAHHTHSCCSGHLLHYPWTQT